MELISRVYRIAVNLYPYAFPRQEDEITWVIEKTTEEATQKLEKVFSNIKVTEIFPIFGCILSNSKKVSYENSMYMVNLLLKHGSAVSIYVLAKNIPDIVSMCTERYEEPKKMEIIYLKGTVIP